MRAAPAFELSVTPGRAERAVLAMIGGACAAAVGAWLWSHVDAAAGPVGHGLAAWIAISLGAGGVGSWLGWMLAPRSPCTLAWHHGQWTLCRDGAVPRAGTVHAKLDIGNWMLLCFRPAAGGPKSWLGVSGCAAGPAWHALRATLFAPGVAQETSGADESVRP
jgi:hypothetical protein